MAMRCGGEGVAVWLEPGIREENEQTCGLGAGNSRELEVRAGVGMGTGKPNWGPFAPLSRYGVTGLT